jgi:hypothetical protein
MYARTNICYKERGSRANYVRPSIPHCTYLCGESIVSPASLVCASDKSKCIWTWNDGDRGKPRNWRKPDAKPHCPPQISHRLTGNRAGASAVKGQKLIACVTAFFITTVYVLYICNVHVQTGTVRPKHVVWGLWSTEIKRWVEGSWTYTGVPKRSFWIFRGWYVSAL